MMIAGSSSSPLLVALSRQVHGEAFEITERAVSQAVLCVARKTTRGAWLASNASCQRGAHRHQRSPGFSPGKPNSGSGVERSLPRDLENSKNAAVMTAQTV